MGIALRPNGIMETSFVDDTVQKLPHNIIILVSPHLPGHLATSLNHAPYPNLLARSSASRRQVKSNGVCGLLGGSLPDRPYYFRPNPSPRLLRYKTHNLAVN